MSRQRAPVSGHLKVLSPQVHAGRDGFRLPSCMDNRPLKFEEWDAMRPQSVCLGHAGGLGDEQAGGVFTEQVIRPGYWTRRSPVSMQVDDPGRMRRVAADGFRVLVTTLTKRMAEDLTEYQRTGHPGALYAFRHRHAGTHRDPARPAARCLRQWWAPAARGAGYSAGWWRFWTPTGGVLAKRNLLIQSWSGGAQRRGPGEMYAETGSMERAIGKPTGGAPNRRPIMRRTGSRPRRSRKTSRTC